MEDEALDPDFYYTDAIADEACALIRDAHQAAPARPFFLYAAFTAPHWPLHARDADVARYRSARTTQAGTRCANAGWAACAPRGSSTTLQR